MLLLQLLIFAVSTHCGNLNLPRRWNDFEFGRQDNTQNNTNGYDQAQLGISQQNTFLLQNTCWCSAFMITAGTLIERHGSVLENHAVV
jgi:hypothetical protein